MSFDDDNERSDHVLFGLHFKATHEEQRKVWRQLCVTKESRNWGRLRSTMFYGHFDADSPFCKSLVEQVEDAEQVMTLLASRLIEEMISARS